MCDRNTMPLTQAEARHAKKLFTAALGNLAHVIVYWLPSRRRIIVRRVRALKTWPLPPEAQLVGTYAHPFASVTFAEDLEDHLASQAPVAGAGAMQPA
jgi:hypothetical protein